MTKSVKETNTLDQLSQAEKAGARLIVIPVRHLRILVDLAKSTNNESVIETLKKPWIEEDEK